jgi:hypothetical protein
LQARTANSIEARIHRRLAEEADVPLSDLREHGLRRHRTWGGSRLAGFLRQYERQLERDPLSDFSFIEREFPALSAEQLVRRTSMWANEGSVCCTE